MAAAVIGAETNPWRKDAEAAGRYAVAFIHPRKKYDRGATVDVIYQLARWACRFAARSMERP